MLTIQLNLNFHFIVYCISYDRFELNEFEIPITTESMRTIYSHSPQEPGSDNG